MTTSKNNMTNNGVTKIMLLHNNNTGVAGERLLPYKVKEALFKKKGIPYYLYVGGNKENDLMTNIFYRISVDEVDEYLEKGIQVWDTTVYHGRSV